VSRIGGCVIQPCGHALRLASVYVDFGKVGLEGGPIVEGWCTSFSPLGAFFVE